MPRPVLLVFAACLAFTLTALPPSGWARAPQGADRDSAGQHPDLSGVWFMQGKVDPSLIAPEDAPLTPWGKEQFKMNRQKVNPVAICLPPGVPRTWQEPAPFEIDLLKNRILIVYEYEHLIRQIHMDRREHPKDAVPTWMGDSIGWWEGDTLVIDTTGFNEFTWVDIWGLPHSDGLHVVERIRRVAPTVLQVDITVADPKAYTKPWMAQKRFDLHPDWKIGEEICEENNTYLFPPGKQWTTEETDGLGKR